MNEKQRKAMGLFRYQVIAPLLNKSPEETMKKAIKRLAEKYYDVPGASVPRKFSYKTIEEWLYVYKNEGYEKLCPARRKDSGESKKITESVGNVIEEILRDRPSIDGATVLKELTARKVIEEGEISLSSFYRFRKSRKLTKQGLKSGTTFRAYEFENPCDCFQTDFLYGPKIFTRDQKFRRTYLIAVIDDCTRVVAHGQFYFDQNLESFLDTLKQAFLKRGVPRRLYLDNGQVFRSNHLMKITATLGIHLIHSRPYQPQGRAKVERYFRTVRTQFLSRIDSRTVHTLEDLNSLFWAWLEGEYHVRKHRTLNEAPLDKWLRLSEHARPLPDVVNLDMLFMHQVSRKVLLDGTFQINKIRFEAPLEFAGKKIKAHYDHNDYRRVFVSCEDNIMGVAYPLDLEANSRVRREEKPKVINSIPKTHLQSLYELRDRYQEATNAENNSTAS